MLTTDYSAMVLHPLDWSPDGKSLAYTQKDGVWIVQEPAYSPTRLVNFPKGTKRGVVWSPDGQHLAVYGDYWVEEEQLWGETIWLVELGTSPQNLLDTIEPYAEKSVNQWLDDNRLTFNVWAGGGLQLLFQVDIESGQITPLLGEAEEQTDPPSIGGQYYWSPTGKQLAIQDCCFGRVILVDVQSGQKEPIGEPFQKFQGWMPTGDQFLYAQYEQGGVSVPADPTLGLWIWELSADSGRKLLPQVYQAAPSPDGSQLAFLQREDRLGQVPARIEPEMNPENWPPALTLGLFSLITGEITFLGPAGYKANEGTSNWEGGRPVWSPDGKLIAYWGEEGDVWLVESSGEWQQRLIEGLEIIDLVWSPDGGKLALRSFDEAWIIERPAKEASISSIKPKQTPVGRTFATYLGVSRESMMASAPLIIAGEVTEITPTRWNQDSGKQWEPTDWDTATTTPLTLYEIEVKIEKSIVNELKLKSPVRLTIIGGSPVDSDHSDIDAKVSDQVIVFARQTELAWQDGKRPIIQLLGAPGDALFIQGKNGLYYSRLPNEEALSLDNLERQVAESRVAEKSEE